MCGDIQLVQDGGPVNAAVNTIRRKALEPQQLKGKRLRADAVNAVAKRPDAHSFWQ